MGTTEARTNRPRVTVKFAQTLDGRIATSSLDGARRISGPDSLRFAHKLRAEHQAILVGVNTVIADDPLLTVRLVTGPNPLRVVVDTRARLPLSAALLHDASPENTLVAHTSDAQETRLMEIRQLGAQTLSVPANPEGRVDLESLLRALLDRGIETIMVEGGARITTELLRCKLVDRLIVCIAPKIIGAGINAVGDLGISLLDQAVTFSELSVRQLGKDVIFDGLVSPADVGANQPASA